MPSRRSHKQPRQGRRRVIQQSKINQIMPKKSSSVSLAITKTYEFRTNMITGSGHIDIDIFSEALAYEPAYTLSGYFTYVQVKRVNIVYGNNDAVSEKTSLGANFTSYGALPSFLNPESCLNDPNLRMFGLHLPASCYYDVSRDLKRQGRPTVYPCQGAVPASTIRLFGSATTAAAVYFGPFTITYYIRLIESRSG